MGAVYGADAVCQKRLFGKNLCEVLLQRWMARIEKSTKLVSQENSNVVLYGYNAASSRHGRLEHPYIKQNQKSTMRFTRQKN